MLKIIFHQLRAFVDNDFEPLPYVEEGHMPRVAFSHSKNSSQFYIIIPTLKSKELD